MIEGMLWRVLLLFIVNLSLSKEESYEVKAFPKNEIPIRSTWNSLERYGHDQLDEQTVEAGRGTWRQGIMTIGDAITEGLPKHRPHMDYLPEYEAKPKTRRKRLKKVKKIKRTEEPTTKRVKKKKKNVKRKNNKVKKKGKDGVDIKRKPFDITVHIKMDDS